MSLKNTFRNELCFFVKSEKKAISGTGGEFQSNKSLNLDLLHIFPVSLAVGYAIFVIKSVNSYFCNYIFVKCET